MHGSPIRVPARFLRAALGVALAIAGLALTPSTASATVLVCNGSACMTIPGGCEDVPSEYICFLVGTGIAVPGPNNHLARDAKGGATIAINGKVQTLVFSWGETRPGSSKFADRGRRGGIDKMSKADFHKAFGEAVRAGDRRVSNENLAKLGRELKLPIAASKPRA